MVTSPINPMRYWKLEEIQRMLNQIEGYENVVVEFKYAPSNGWNSDHYDCTCGIKEQLVNGEWNWLLKYEFQVNDKLELADVRLAAFQEMAERLVRDVWRTSINSFRNEQKQLNSFKQRTEFKNPPLTEEQTSNFITKIENMTNEKTNIMNNNIQTNNTTWTDNETTRWIMSTIIVALVLFGMYSLYKYELAWPTAVTAFGIYLVSQMLLITKDFINYLLNKS